MKFDQLPRHGYIARIMKTTLLVFAGIAALAGAAQQPATPYVPKQSDRPEAVAGDEAGFQPIFDGKTLDGWEGDPTYWRVENGSLVGEITPATVIKSNTFIIWRGGSAARLRAEARLPNYARG